MKLSDLLAGYPIVWQHGDAEIVHITHDSREIRPGSLFVAISGFARDGHAFIAEAKKRGAVALLCERTVDTDLPVVQVSDARRAMSYLAARLYKHPADALTMVGITGTKGKTTVSHLLYETARAAGKTPGLIGTNGVLYGNTQYDIANTTPESSDLHRILRQMADAGVDTVFMEVSSGGLKLARVADVPFALGIFTNLAQDHLGPSEHADMAEYAHWKSRLFLQCEKALLFSDDKKTTHMKNKAKKDFYYGTKGDYAATSIRFGQTLQDPTQFVLAGKHMYPVAVAAPGAFSVHNALAVIGAADQLGYPKEAALSVLAGFSVAGRAESLPAPDGIQIVLDYAHNALSLQAMLQTLRQYKPQRLLVLLGSVGGRTKNRRRELGDAAAQWADVVMLTSDNPNQEDPKEIIEDMAESFVGTDTIVYKEPDRGTAVNTVLQLLQKGDILLLAGKGHEEFQRIHGKQIPYSDKEVVRAFYASR